jgi:DNA repair protein RecO (recombination protein O)
LSKIFHTKAIVLKTIPYGETSMVVTALTELFGLQTYMIKGVRTATKKQNSKANYFQSGAILDMEVYHHPLKQMNFVKEYKWAVVYQHIFTNVVKNCVCLYCIELTQKCLKQPDENPEHYYVLENLLLQIDTAEATQLAAIPIQYALILIEQLGLLIMNNYDAQHHILDLQNGNFISQPPVHINYVDEPISGIISNCISAMNSQLLLQTASNKNSRKQTLAALELFFQLHISDFGKIKSLSIMSEVLS